MSVFDSVKHKIEKALKSLIAKRIPLEDLEREALDKLLQEIEL